MSAHSGTLEAVDRILNRGGEPDEVLRAVVAALESRRFRSARVTTAAGELLAEAGEPSGEPTARAPIVRNGRTVGELCVVAADADPRDQALVERVALLVSAQLPV